MSSSASSGTYDVESFDNFLYEATQEAQSLNHWLRMTPELFSLDEFAKRTNVISKSAKALLAHLSVHGGPQLTIPSLVKECASSCEADLAEKDEKIAPAFYWAMSHHLDFNVAASLDGDNTSSTAEMAVASLVLIRLALKTEEKIQLAVGYVRDEKDEKEQERVYSAVQEANMQILSIYAMEDEIETTETTDLDLLIRLGQLLHPLATAAGQVQEMDRLGIMSEKDKLAFDLPKILQETAAYFALV